MIDIHSFIYSFIHPSILLLILVIESYIITRPDYTAIWPAIAGWLS